MAGFLSQIKQFDKKSALQQVTTRVTKADGSVFEEKIDESGQLKQEAKGKILLPQFLQDSQQGKSRLTPYVFDKDKQKWTSKIIEKKEMKEEKEEKNTQKSEQQNTVTFITYNVWFSDNYWKERGEALFKLVSKYTPSVICFQEVTDKFLDLLLTQSWVREHYYVSDSSGSTIVPYGVIMLINKTLTICSISIHALPTNMGRRFLLTKLMNNNNIEFKVGTVHLESRSNEEMRKSQLETIMKILNNGKIDIHFLMGDFNIDREKENTNSLKKPFPQYLDTWPELYPDVDGMTLEDGSRIDRIMFYASDRHKVKPTVMQIIGKEKISDEAKVGPSDHYGLFASFQIN